MRIILKIVKWLALVLIALTIIMFAINWSDQPPSSAALEMSSLLDQGSGIPDEENAFVYAMGFPAPQESDPVNSGVECIAKLNTAVHKEAINFETDLDCWDRSSSEYDNTTISKIFMCAVCQCRARPVRRNCKRMSKLLSSCWMTIVGFWSVI